MLRSQAAAMIGTPPLLTETPEPEALTPAADLLSDLLRVVRLAGSVFWKAEFAAPFAISSGGCETVEQLLLRASPRHITVFHMIAEGRCWLERPEGGRVLLVQGDIIMLPFGGYHEIGNGEAPVVPALELVQAQSQEGVITAMRHGGDGERTTIVCGYVQSGDLFANPVFRDLPPLIVERTATEPVTTLLASTVHQLLGEVDALRPGSRAMLGRMMEMLFFEMLRRHVARLPKGAMGWLAALTDPLVSRALQRLHGDPSRCWTVECLAAEVGASRSVLAERFKAVLGQPPMQYLAAWRLQLATNLLRDPTQSIAGIAGQIGYESEAAFNRAFKRHIGLPPGAWRDQNAARA